MNKRKSSLYLLSVILIMITVLPLFFATFFMVPAADDFSNAGMVLAKSNNIFKSAALLTVEEYFSWQGTFTVTFLLHAASPILRGGIAGIRVGSFIIVSFYVASIYFLVYSVAKYVLKENRLYVINLVYGVSVWLFTRGECVGEALYWFCGGMVHTLPLSFFMLGTGFLIRVLKLQHKKRNIGMAVICMIIASGGSLQVAAACNVTALGILILNWRNSEIRKNTLPVFVSAFLTALINAGAPGNFARHGVIDDEYHLLKAIGWSIESVAKNIRFHLLETPIIILLLFLGVMGYQYGKRRSQENRKIFFIGLFVLVSAAITDFPVMFGYSSIELSERCQFIENNIVGGVLMFLGFLGGSALARYDLQKVISSSRRSGFVFAGFVLIYLLGCTSEMEIDDYTPANIWINFANGNLNEFKQEYDEIFSCLEGGEGKDVEIECIPNDLDIFRSIGIQEDPSYWVNATVAHYYGCNSVFLSPEE